MSDLKKSWLNYSSIIIQHLSITCYVLGQPLRPYGTYYLERDMDTDRIFFLSMQRNQSYIITKHAVKKEVHDGGRAGVGGTDHVWGIVRECSEELTFRLRSEKCPGGNLVTNYH